MAVSLVLTVLGDDRPGFVETLSAKVAENGANWLESRMTHLAGKFAGIVHIEVPDAKADDVQAALIALNAEDLQVVVGRSTASSVPAKYIERIVELTGSDHPGIVHDFTRVLAGRNISIEELTTDTDSASMAGGKVFRAIAVVHVPESLDLADLQDDLEDLANDLMVDISLGIEL